MLNRASDLGKFLHKCPKLRKTDMRFDTWIVSSLYRAGAFMTVATEISKYTLDFVGPQEGR
jgi:hypothetical protein